MQKFINGGQSKSNSYKVGAVFSYATLALNCLVSIFFTPYIIRCLGEGEYGLYQLIGAFAGYLSIMDMGMSSAVTKYVAKYYRQNETKKQENFLAVMVRYYICISVIVLIIGSVMYGQIGNLFSDTLSNSEVIKARRMFILLIMNLIITLFGGIFRGVMSAYECFLQTKGAEFARVILRVFMIYGILFLGGDSIGLVTIDTLLNVVFFVYRMAYCFRMVGIRIHYYGIDKAELKEVIFFSFFVFLNLVFDQLNWKIDHTILGIKESTIAVTVYSIGMNFSNYFMNFSVAVKSLFLPKVMHMETDGADGQQYTEFLIRTGKMQGYLLFYLYFAFLIFGRQFISLIMGKDYYEAWLSAVLVMTGLLVPLLQNAGHPILQAKNKHHVYVVVCLCISVVNAVSTWFIVDSKGIVGAAFMTMISFVVGQGIFLSWYYNKKIGIKMTLFFKEIIKNNIMPIVGAVFAGGLLIQNVVIDTWLSFLICGGIYSLIYWLSTYIWGMSKQDKDFLFGFLKNYKRS